MNEYINYLDETIAGLKKEEEELIRENRKDEANFVRIKSNICDICRTMYQVSVRFKSDEELKEDYIRKLTKLPENWKISLEKAKEHGDVEKIMIEEIKLEMLQILRDKFEETGV